MKSKMLAACFCLFALFVNGQNRPILLSQWVEYLKTNISAGETPVELAELIFYTVDKRGNKIAEVVGPSVPNPISLKDVNLSSNLITMKVSTDGLVSYKRDDLRRSSKTSAKKEALQSKGSSDILLNVDKILLNFKTNEMMFEGEKIIVSLHELMDHCIGKFNLDGVEYAVELRMKKAKLDQGGNLILL